METEPVRIELPKPQGYRCFACGTINPMGLNMSFYSLGQTVRSDVTLGEFHVGWENIAHGGLISTILDETMAWAVIAFKRVFFVTRSMEIRYLRPVLVNVPLTAIGEIEADTPGKSCVVKGALVDAEGTKLASAVAEMSILPEKRLHMLPPKYKGDMEIIFGQMIALLG